MISGKANSSDRSELPPPSYSVNPGPWVSIPQEAKVSFTVLRTDLNVPDFPLITTGIK